MRVSIQYSVELEEVPLEIRNLIDTTVVERLLAVVGALEGLSVESNPEQALTTIDEARKALYCADERLSDLDGILRGYIVQRASEVQSGESQKRQPTPTEQAGVDPQMAEAGAISEEAMKIVRAKLAEHKLETDALRRTMNLGFDEPLDDEGADNES